MTESQDLLVFALAAFVLAVTPGPSVLYIVARSVSQGRPKTALFFLAFLPQFVVPSRGDVALQAALLGGLFLLIAFCTDSSWSLLASGAGRWLKDHPRYVTSERYVVGSVYLGLGVATALAGGGRK